MPPRRNTRLHPKNSENLSGQSSHNKEGDHEDYNEFDDQDYDEEEHEDSSAQGHNQNPMNFFVNFLRQHVNPNPTQQPTPIDRNIVAKFISSLQIIGTTRVLEDFRPRKSKSMVEGNGETYEILQVEEEQKTVFATYLLRREAYLWWEAKKNLEGEGVVA